MKDISEQKKIAVLIDGDNAQCAKMKLILDELSAHGHILTKRAYGDWSADNLKNWKKTLNELAIQPVQQFAYTTGKNSTDASMIIDAMDLLYSGKFDAFALVSSDSDFTKLASRLREEEIFVFGVGETKTPISFRNACDDFILTENLGAELLVEKAVPAEHGADKKNVDSLQLVQVLTKAWEQYQDAEGWAGVGAAGSFLKRAAPDFDPRTYGAIKLSDVIAGLSHVFEIRKVQGTGTATNVDFRLKSKQKKSKKKDAVIRAGA